MTTRRVALLAAATLSFAVGTALAQGGGSGSVTGPGGAEGPDNASTMGDRYPGGSGAAGPQRNTQPPAQTQTAPTAGTTTGTSGPGQGMPQNPKPPEQPGTVPGQPSGTPD
jgi:hypothetical protein